MPNLLTILRKRFDLDLIFLSHFFQVSKQFFLQILLSVLDRHEDFDVNEKNFKGEFALGLAVRHRHSYVVEAIIN